MYKITLVKSSRKLPIFSKSPRVIYWSIIPITSHLFEWAVGAKIRKRFDRLPFQVCPRFFIISHYAKNVKRSFVCKSPRKHHPNNTYQKREHASRLNWPQKVRQNFQEKLCKAALRKNLCKFNNSDKKRYSGAAWKTAAQFFYSIQ